ncbi:aldehyde dehydrogenase family protein [Palleronia sp. KMU-117]|uniref:aldehyde dehydrogenase family protein n=1 Tax=Palleronia sp. KMU-117 TaxID=3434108 RepID=UPI003D70FDCF
MIERREFYIDGAWVAPTASRDFTVINPSTEEPAAVISLGGEADTNAAVAAANRAFADWSTTAPDERIAIVERALEIYLRRKDEMGDLISLEMGAPRTMARRSQADECNIVDALAAARDFHWLRPTDPKTPGSMIAMEAIGTIGMITPWNWPISQVTLKVFPALLAGCTMVLKPSEYAPLDAMLLADILHEAGVPKGVFNLVNGDGEGVGTQLSRHPGIDMISFTGSTRAGIAITKAAADSLKRVSLELGGKGANIVFADADDRAVQRGVRHCFNNTGQSCNAPTRMLVERSIYDRAVETAREVAEATRVGPAHEEGPHIGPLVNERQFDRVQALIQKGIDEGARLVAGGVGRPEGLNRGFFVRPTVFADVVPGMTVEREEIFGPVLSMIPFDTEEEAIAIANDTPYGLTNYVQSQNGARRNRLARRLRSGMVEMNGKSRGAGAPFGGVKASGLAREGGVWGLEEYLTPKSISDWAAE